MTHPFLELTQYIVKFYSFMHVLKQNIYTTSPDMFTNIANACSLLATVQFDSNTAENHTVNKVTKLKT